MALYNDAIIERYAAPVPRYTSYPTAPHFNENVQGPAVKAWMKTIAPDERVSLYLHIPFCDRLCWFCGCHTKHTLKYAPVQAYLQTLYKEMALTRDTIGRKQALAHIHLGGGSPSLLRPQDLADLKRALLENFIITPSTEISLEFDPTDLDAERLKAFAGFGVTRASLGVQDFSEKTQTAINRPQTFEQTKFVVDTLRDYGVKSLNIDALYGLPYQTLDTLEATLAQVKSLSPDRVALFGYAHVPWVKPHQKLIPDESLPGARERFDQARMAESFFTSAGYDAIGIDHFALPTDSLAKAHRARRTRRNFQGYTTDNCRTLIGLGVSSVSEHPGGYAQNVKDTHSYTRLTQGGIIPAARGIAISEQDRMIGAAINELMCFFTLTPADLCAAYGQAASGLIAIAEQAAQRDTDGFFIKSGDRFLITEAGRPFARTFAAKFDARLQSDAARYSAAV